MHCGLPMRKYGFSSAMRRRALSRCSARSKSHALPSQSAVVRSSAKPGIRRRLGITFRTCVTRGRCRSQRRPLAALGCVLARKPWHYRLSP